MPLYEYHCDKCGNRFEVLQKFSESPLTEHEGCGGSVKRLLSAPGLQFKGSGWYITDYKGSGASRGDSKSESKTDTNGDSKPVSSESKSESKPAESKKSD